VILHLFSVGFYSYYIFIAENFNRSVRADYCAYGAAGAVGILGFGGEIAVFVGILGYSNAAFRTDCNTQAAAFATLGIYYYFSRHNR
jgi:hypothetical protein